MLLRVELEAVEVGERGGRRDCVLVDHGAQTQDVDLQNAGKSKVCR